MNKKQQEQVGCMTYWVSQWRTGLDLSHAKTCHGLEPTEHQQFKIKQMDWHAYMARKECLDLGMDPEIVLQPALITCADRWYADNVKGTEDEWCFEQAAQ